MINEDGTNPIQITNPPRAGEWGNSVLPFGDYDPYLSPNGIEIVFERLVNDQTSHGNYDIYKINIETKQEEALTNTGYTQGLPVLSYMGDRIVYLVGAIGEQGHFDLYLMNSDGSENQNITPKYYPEEFLCHDPIFSKDDSKIYFIGEWYSD
jgi:Tol biopolymer transport system component